jgi:hypothetical protein
MGDAGALAGLHVLEGSHCIVRGCGRATIDAYDGRVRHRDLCIGGARAYLALHDKALARSHDATRHATSRVSSHD